MEVTPHALQAVQVRLKSVSNEGHFTLEAETVFRMYLLTNCCGFTEISHIALSTNLLQEVQFMLKSVSNERQFTLKAEKFVVVSPLSLQWCD
jgi:hypothetical protein